GLASVPAEVLEVDLVVLDPADRERELDLEGADLRVHLVRRGELDLPELPHDLVALVHVPLVELVVRLDRCTRDPVELVDRGLELARGDLLVVEGKRRHWAGPFARLKAGLSIAPPPRSKPV